MTIEEIKNLKKGDKFWIGRYAGMSSEFQEKILGLEITPFNMIEVTFEEFPNGWYIPKSTNWNDEYIAWTKCKVQGLMVDIHSTSLKKSADKSKTKCQAMLLNSQPWEIKTPNDFKLLEASRELYPELFI